MYKRCFKPLREFILSNYDKCGRYYIDCQFGRVGIVNKTYAGSITTRIDANGCTFLVEISKKKKDNKRHRICFGLGRSRDEVGNIKSLHLNTYVNCLHTMLDSGFENMHVLVACCYEKKTKNCEDKH